MSEFNRRKFLAGTTTAALAATALGVRPTAAAAPAAGKPGPGVYRFKIGSFELTALYDGTWFRKIDEKFVRNAGVAQVN